MVTIRILSLKLPSIIASMLQVRLQEQKINETFYPDWSSLGCVGGILGYI